MDFDTFLYRELDRYYSETEVYDMKENIIYVRLPDDVYEKLDQCRLNAWLEHCLSITSTMYDEKYSVWDADDKEGTCGTEGDIANFEYLVVAARTMPNWRFIEFADAVEKEVNNYVNFFVACDTTLAEMEVDV